MKKKNLAEEYAEKLYEERNGEYLILVGNDCFNIADIENAFNDGRESVVGNIPNLEWERCVGGYLAETPIFNYYIEINETAKEKYTLIVPEINPMAFSRIYEAKCAAQENYKQRIKKALGL